MARIFADLFTMDLFAGITEQPAPAPAASAEEVSARVMAFSVNAIMAFPANAMAVSRYF